MLIAGMPAATVGTPHICSFPPPAVHPPTMILPPGCPTVLQVSDEAADGGWVEWLPVTDFARSTEHDRHYQLDPVSGEVQFGPAVRQPDGGLRQYGAIPPKGSTLRMSAYRVGGGSGGNVARGQVRVLKTSVPYVARVENRHPASGGVEGERPSRTLNCAARWSFGRAAAP